MTSEEPSAAAPQSRVTPSSHDAPAGTRSLLDTIERIQDSECREIIGEAERAQKLLSEASAELMTSFSRLGRDTLSQQDRMEALLSDMSGAVRDDGSEGLNIAAFVSQTASVLQSFAEVLVHFSKQSVKISYKIDDMVEHMDAIFELVSQVDSIAEETNILAINAALEAARAGEAGKGFKVVASEVRMLSRDTKALNDEIGLQVDAARAVILDVREAAREIASQDMSIALTAKGGVDDMLGRLQGMDDELSKSLDEMSTFTAKVKNSADAAIRSMQFEDMVTQTLQHVIGRATRLRSLLRDVRDAVPQAADGTPENLEAMTEMLAGLSLEAHKAVEQESMDAGDVELF